MILPKDANDWLDDEFPLGDGVADTAAWVVCPYCGEEAELLLDPGGSAHQTYIEDCEVCCRPWHITVTWDDSGEAHVDVRSEEET